MKSKKLINTHYLSVNYKMLINRTIIHYILFILEIYIIILHLMEISNNNFKSYMSVDDIKIFNPFTFLTRIINKLPNILKFIIYLLIMIILIINYIILNIFRIKESIFMKIMVNVSELLFYRLLTLFIFDYLLLFNGYYLLINIIFTLPFLFVLILNLLKNHLFLFFPSIISYPYDCFSMIIDLHLVIIKIFVSLSDIIPNENISILFFIISIIIFFVLFLYLSFIIIKKSYYLMNNCNLNKVRYSFILATCMIIIFLLTAEKNDLNNYYYTINMVIISIVSLLYICFFYDPYQYCKFERDDNIENIYYYFFILDRDKNKYLLIEEKIEEHISNCNKCNLCKKYKNYKKIKKNEEIDLYSIISNSKNLVFNLFNNLLRGIRKYGKESFVDNSYYLINLIYIYNYALIQKNFNFLINIELLFIIINSENTQFFEEHKISLNQIKYVNTFLVKSNNIIRGIYKIFDEKNAEKKSENFFNLAELLNKLKYKEIKSNFNHNNGNYNGKSNSEGSTNYNNLLTICSLFYEELYNESISNSGIYIRDSPNLVEDLINNNSKNSKQITLEINNQNNKVIIIRAGGHMNKYENNNLLDIFPSIFKNKQITEMKKLLLYSNNNSMLKSKKKQNNKKKKKNESEKQYLNFIFIIEEKEDMNIFYRILKLKLSLILLANFNMIFYLNGVYTLDKDIIVTEKKKGEEILLHFGNLEQLNRYNKKTDKNIIIKTVKNNKYLGHNKLIKDYNSFIGCNKYNVYHIVASEEENVDNNTNDKAKISSKVNNVEEGVEEKLNLYDENNEFLFNDIASQAPSASTPAFINIINYNNKGNKKSKSDDNFIQKFNLVKIILILTILSFFIFIILQGIYLINSQESIDKRNNFYLLFMDYSSNFYTLFFSSLSLICTADSNESYNCIHYMNETTKLAVTYSKIIVTLNITDSILSNNLKDKDNIFIDFTKLIFVQNGLLYQQLDGKLEKIINYLASFNEKDKFLKYFKNNVSHYKLNQVVTNNIKLFLTKENFEFYDFFVLMTSRLGIITRDYNNLINPIYILNKTGEEVFNNVFVQEKINTYQENIYLMILDYNLFLEQLDLIINEISNFLSSLKYKFKKMLYVFLNLNLIYIIIILLIIFGYLVIYLLVIYNILDEVYNNLNKKLGDVSIKEIIRKKIDNLKCLLNFYENDVNVTLDNLNNIYNDYHDKYNLKIKEKSKLMKKQGNIEIKSEDKMSCLKLFELFKNFNLYKYSERRNLYSYTLIFIIIISLSIYIIGMVLWTLYFRKDDIVTKWISIASSFNLGVSKFMNNLLMMIYNNKTIEEVSSIFEPNDSITYIFGRLTKLYEGNKYFNQLSDIATINDQNINFDCLKFYQELNNEFFEKLKNKFINEQEQLYTTMYYFCEWSNVMMFKNYKTIYLHLFNQVKVIMENFINKTYNDIIMFFYNNEIVKIEIIFLITYSYLLDISYSNINSFLLAMVSRMESYIIVHFICFIAILIFLTFVIFFIYLRNVNNDCEKFIKIKKVFKVCNANE